MIVPRVFLPAEIRALADQHESVNVTGTTVAEVLEALDTRYPGVRQRLCDGNQLRSGLVVSVGHAISALGLLQPVSDTDEIHFLPSVGGG